jgi:hypothetical protein
MSKRPDFTYEQIDFICYQIGEWYCEWKNNITTGDGHGHRLGYAKELLKARLCGDGSIEVEYKSCVINLYDNDNHWRYTVTYSPVNAIIHRSMDRWELKDEAIEHAKKFIDSIEG